MLWAASCAVPRASATPPEPTSPPRVLDAPRFYASPVGEARWLDVGAGLLVVSDLASGAAALRLETGETVWNAAAFRAHAERVEVVGERVVMIGAAAEVLDRQSGQLAWRRELGCGLPDACTERVAWVGPEGLLVVADRGGEGARVGLMGLDDGKPRWRNAAPVAQLRAVAVGDGVVHLLEGGAQATLRSLELSSGRQRAQVALGEALGSGTPLLVARPGGGALLALPWTAQGRPGALRVLGADGEGRALPVAMPESGAGGLRWLGAGAASVLGLTGDRAGEQTLLAIDLNGSVRVALGSVASTPILLGDRALVVQRQGGLDRLSGYGLSQGRAVWERDGVAEAAPGRWLPAGEAGLYVGGGAPAIGLLVQPERGRVLAAGELGAVPEAVHGAAFAGDLLYVAAGRGVFVHPLVPVATIASRITAALDAGAADEASALLEPLRRSGVRWPDLGRLDALVARASAMAVEEAMARGGGAEAIAALVAPLAAAATDAGPGLAGAARRVTALVGDHLLDPFRRWDPDEIAALERVVSALSARLRDLPPAVAPGALDGARRGRGGARRRARGRGGAGARQAR
ncbi:MAG: PQQ-binding-like beta-propeller repeat protein [Deltaproteobacteria bacterium]|nr:PQQ-binding-like beta-propeller repeat protein [Deltaproteobacteria bacterium]